MRFPTKLCVLLLAVAAVSTNVGPDQTSTYPRKFLEIMSKHFSDSLKYLYTSKQFDSQYMQRPGMAKYLMEASDFEWEQGIDFLKKYMQRQGNISYFKEYYSVSGKGNLTLAENEDKFEKYFETYTILTSDAQDKFNQMNNVRRDADAEICHYLDGKMEKNVARTYEFKILSKNLQNMKTLGIAVNAFDSAL